MSLLVHSNAGQQTALDGMAQIKCPVCQSGSSKQVLYCYKAEEAAAHFCPVMRDESRYRRLYACISRLWQGNECYVLCCNECGFAFGAPFVGGDEEFYSILHEQRDYPKWRWDYDVAMSEALSVMKPGRILDIGAGAGVFLRSLDAQWERHAVEGSELTRGELEESGIRVFRDLSEAARREAGTFRVVTLFQVLEHIAEFAAVLNECRRLLCSGGRLVITVPNGEAMIRQEQVTGCPDMPPNHICKWTSNSLARALLKAGFDVERTVYEPSSWRNLVGNLHLRLMTDATKESSIAAQVYRARNKHLRVLGLACLSIPALFRMLSHARQLKRGGAFGMIGVAR